MTDSPHGKAEMDTKPRPLCPKCANKGAILVRYRDGGTPDLALCDCIQGAAMRAFSDDEIRARFTDLRPDSRIANLEDFNDDESQLPDVTNAGRRPLAPRL